MPSETTPGTRVGSKRLLLVILASLLIPITPFVITGELPGERWLSATDANALRFAATGAALLAADVVLPIPSSIIGTLMGARLGLASGWPWVWFGLTLGNVIGYGAGRLLLARVGAPVPQEPTLLVLLISRPVPVLAEASTFVAGASKTPWWPFLVVCASGNALYALALTGNGAALLPTALAGPGLILPLALPVVAWLIWRGLARRSGNKRTRS